MVMTVLAQTKSTTICANPYELKIQIFWDAFIIFWFTNKQWFCKNIKLKNNQNFDEFNIVEIGFFILLDFLVEIDILELPNYISYDTNIIFC